MPNIGSVLKSEISRLSKRVVRQEIAPVHSSSSAQRKQIAALRKQVEELRRQFTALQRALPKKPEAPTADAGTEHRFSAKGLRSLRKNLGLSADDFGRLIEASAQSVYNWESEKAKPRAALVAKIAAVRAMGKREVKERLAAAK